MKYRAFLFHLVVASIVLGSNVWGQPAPTGNFTKEDVLRNIVQTVITSGYQTLDSKCRELTNALEQLTQAPTAASLEEARIAWRAAAQAAGKMQCFQKGPIADRECISTFYYWQILPFRLEEVLQSSKPIDQTALDQMGATAKGVFGLEYLLFPRAESNSTNLTFAGPQGDRRRAYIQATARDVQTKAEQIARDWSATGEGNAAAKFVKDGQESVNVLVNQLAFTIENVAERRLNFVLQLPHPVTPQLDRIERSRSGSSIEGALAALEGARQLYRGGEGLGLDDLVKKLNGPLQQRVDDHFDAAITAIRDIGKPLENAVTENRASLERALEKTHALELLMKVDLASTLGVTLTFSSTDGD